MEQFRLTPAKVHRAAFEWRNGTTWLIAKQSLVLYSEKAMATKRSLLTESGRSKESHNHKSGGGYRVHKTLPIC